MTAAGSPLAPDQACELPTAAGGAKRSRLGSPDRRRPDRAGLAPIELDRRAMRPPCSQCRVAVAPIRRDLATPTCVIPRTGPGAAAPVIAPRTVHGQRLACGMAPCGGRAYGPVWEPARITPSFCGRVARTATSIGTWRMTSRKARPFCSAGAGGGPGPPCPNDSRADGEASKGTLRSMSGFEYVPGPVPWSAARF